MHGGNLTENNKSDGGQANEVCAIYTRVSTSAQADEGVSLEAQRDSLTEVAQFKHWDVYAYYEDAGFTGTNKDRPDLQRMLADAKKHKFTKIVVYKLDRLSRSVKDFCDMLADDFQPNGVGVYASAQDLNTDTSSGKLIVNILVSFAAFESDLIKERTTDAYAKLKVKRRLLGPAPFGYRRENQKLVPVEAELNLVKEVYEKYMAGKSEWAIAKLHEADLTRDLVRDMLSNPVYTGKVAYGRRRGSLPGSHGKKYAPVKPLAEWNLQDLDQPYVKPVVSFEKWQAVQARRESFPAHRPSQTVALFQGILYCSPCNHFLSVHGSREGKTKYSCDSDHHTRTKRLRSDNGEAVVANGTKWFCAQQVWEQYLEAPVVDALETAIKDFKPRLKLVQKLRDTQARLTRAQSAFDITTRRALSSERLTDQEAERIIGDAQRKLDVRKEELKVLQDDANAELAVKNILKTGFGEFYKSMTRPERQELLHVLIRRIDVGSSFLTIHWSFSDDVARISRSKVMPKKGRVPKTAACPVANNLTGETSAAGNEAGLSTTSQMGEFEPSQNSIDNSENMNRNTSIDEGSEKGKNVVEIGALNHAAEHPASQPESAVVDALADALLQVRSRDSG
ncbi:MAG TPA: recombinase family protein [Candidatus Deferrimicrobium sp.]|nr:recombinase family protein [Candidatus Deferrimicrobium sp.]